ncbi:MAG: YihY/virulence factor BrkB family protein [Acidobacteriota bacterium]
MSALTSSVSRVDPRLDPRERRIWELVSTSPVANLWRSEVPAKVVAQRTWKAMLDDRLFGYAAELAFYFLFALFPMLLSASAILGLVARSAHQFYFSILHYLYLVVPRSALGMVLKTFTQTTAEATSGKITFGLAFAIWSASSGVSAVQDTLDAVYKLVDRRSYLWARLQAIGLTLVLMVTISLCLASMFGSDLVAKWAHSWVSDPAVGRATEVLVRIVGWALAILFLTLSFTVTYHWAPDLRRPRWRWFTPGQAIGIVAWLLASIGLRIYLHFFNNYSVTYGSLGAVIILLTWFYITGLMLLVGAEIDSEIEAAVVEKRVEGETHTPQRIAPAA